MMEYGTHHGAQERVCLERIGFYYYIVFKAPLHNILILLRYRSVLLHDSDDNRLS